jgi:hypothetical protein
MPVVKKSPGLATGTGCQLLVIQGVAPIGLIRRGLNYSPFGTNSWDGGEKIGVYRCKFRGPKAIQSVWAWRKIQPRGEVSSAKSVTGARDQARALSAPDWMDDSTKLRKSEYAAAELAPPQTRSADYTRGF